MFVRDHTWAQWQALLRSQMAFTTGMGVHA
jgi:hypothetical protein